MTWLMRGALLLAATFLSTDLGILGQKPQDPLVNQFRNPSSIFLDVAGHI